MKEVKIKCANCKGTGYIAHYDYNCNGICFKCIGKGWIMEKQYTKEELKKKEEKINKKHFESIKELRGFKNNDILYLVMDQDTYNRKQEIKQDGAKWNMFFRKWTFENNNLGSKYNLKPVKFEDTIKEV